MEGDLILIKIHHGGSFSKEGELSYDGGEVSNFPDYDSDRISYFRLVRLAKTVGWKDGDELYYKSPGRTLETGIDLVHNDDSLLKMLSFAKKNNLAELYIKHNGHEGLPVNPRNGVSSDDKLLEEVMKPKDSKFTTKKRDKRTWTAEEKLLIDILHEMNDSCWKVDTGHKSGYLTYVEKKMAIKLPHADLKADPHIKSKVKILKKQLSYILEIMQNGSGFGWDDEKKMVIGDRETYMGWAKSREGAGPLYMKPMINFDKLCEIYASDLAKGGSAKGPGEEVAEDEPTKDGEHTIELGEGDVSEAHGNTNNTSGGHKNGRKRTYADVDTLEMGFVNVSNSFAKFLEAEQQNTNTMNGIHKALHRESEVHDKASENRDKFLEVLQDLPGLTDKEVVMAIRVIGPDAGRIDFFLKMRAQFKVEFVRQELEVAKKKQVQSGGAA